MSRSLIREEPTTTADGDLIVVPTAVVRNAETVGEAYRMVRFRGRAMIEVETPFPHFKPLHKEQFDRIAYPILGGKTRGQMNDTFAYLCNTVEDLTSCERYILFGRVDVPEGADGPDNHKDSVVSVWDMEALTTTPLQAILPSSCVWRCPFAKIPTGDSGPIEFIMQLAGGDQGHYDDIMQALAPLVMDQKPDGVIWFVGDGANGKSTLMSALYHLFPDQLASLTVKRLTDGRDTPSLNGQLGNIVKESSEGRIDDTEIYKSIGTHENFRVHKFHSQDDIEIRGNMHHIFNANVIPTFNDKGYSARRRTYIIPFSERFQSDPTFEKRTFTPEFFGRLAHEICVYAKRLERQGYKYKWSAKTLGAKADYDTEANNAEEYAAELINQGIVAFDSFQPVKMDYENWCAESGYVPLGIGNMRRALQAAGFMRSSRRLDNGGTSNVYRIMSIDTKDLKLYGLGRIGMYTVDGFEPTREPQLALDTPVEDINIVRGW